jgi:hypothetical protein
MAQAVLEQVRVSAPGAVDGKPQSLTQALAMAGISVIPLWQVDAFKAQFRRKEILRQLMRSGVISAFLVGVTLVALGVLFAGFASRGTDAAVLANAKMETLGNLVEVAGGILGLAIASVVAVIGGILAVFIAPDMVAQVFRETRWINVGIGFMRSSVYCWASGLVSRSEEVFVYEGVWGMPFLSQAPPLAAADAARRVRVVWPTATFSVDRLAADPFLYAEDRATGEKFCIYHWDEPFVER